MLCDGYLVGGVIFDLHVPPVPGRGTGNPARLSKALSAQTHPVSELSLNAGHLSKFHPEGKAGVLCSKIQQRCGDQWAPPPPPHRLQAGTLSPPPHPIFTSPALLDLACDVTTSLTSPGAKHPVEELAVHQEKDAGGMGIRHSLHSRPKHYVSKHFLNI